MKPQEPTIRLIPIENTVVNTRTQEEHTLLLRVYEFCGWRWLMGDLPTTINRFTKFREQTYLKAEDKFLYGSTRDPWVLDGSRKVIVPREFYNLQKVTLKDIIEINNFFSRTSGGNDPNVNLALYLEKQRAEWDAEQHP